MDESAIHGLADDHAVVDLIQQAEDFLSDVPDNTVPRSGLDSPAAEEMGAAGEARPTSQAADKQDQRFVRADDTVGRPYGRFLEKLAAAVRKAANHPAGRAGVAAAALSLTSNLGKLRAGEVTFVGVIEEAAWVSGEAALTTVAVALAAAVPAQGGTATRHSAPRADASG